MKLPEHMTEAETNMVFAVLMDSQLQNELLHSPEHKDVWMLDYLYDSVLRLKLENYVEKQAVKESLENILPENEFLLKNTKI